MHSGPEHRHQAARRWRARIQASARDGEGAGGGAATSSGHHGRPSRGRERREGMEMVRVWGEHRHLPVLVRRNGRTAVGSESDGERRLGGSWAGMRPVRERRASRTGPV